MDCTSAAEDSAAAAPAIGDAASAALIRGGAAAAAAASGVAASASRSVTPSAPGSSKPATTAALAVPSTGTAAGGMGGDDISEWRCSPVTSRTARDVVGIGSGSGADAIVAASLARSGVPLHLVDGVHCAVSCTSWCSSNGFFCCWC